VNFENVFSDTDASLLFLNFKEVYRVDVAVFVAKKRVSPPAINGQFEKESTKEHIPMSTLKGVHCSERMIICTWELKYFSSKVEKGLLLAHSFLHT